jgi:hypothetical protein
MVILISCTALALLAMLFVPPISQDLSYHRFADRNTILNIPNFWNVFSNLPFILVGLMGLRELFMKSRGGVLTELITAYRLFFVSVTLIGLGSAYYHLWPDNATLVWDRAPMAVAFMAFFAIIVGENISVRWGRRLQWPFVLIGILSVLYWRCSESIGMGDLRPYALVQFLPMLLIPLILVMYRSSLNGGLYIWYVLYCYVLSKYMEMLDERIYRFLDPVSGHALKHLLAALGGYFFLLALRKRQRLSPH